MASSSEPERLFEPPAADLPSIESIQIEQLHGKFSYRIDLATPKTDVTETGGIFAVNEDRLTLLYGNNGTGKTSLLRLLFHALSPAGQRGHRLALAETRFQSLVIRLTDGTEIRYLRGSDPGGAFRAELDPPAWTHDGEPASKVAWDFYPEDDPRRLAYTTTPTITQSFTPLGQGFSEEQFVLGAYVTPEQEFHERLAALQLNPVFLSDARAIRADILDPDESNLARHQAALRRAARAGRVASQRPRQHDVVDALDRLRGYLSQLAFAGTQAGAQRVDTVYLDVARAIVQHASKVGRPNKVLLPSLRQKVEELGARAQPYHEYGLLPAFPAANLLELLEGAPDKNGPLLEKVLTPYLDGLVERMDALEPGLRAISSFMDALNSFLEGKRGAFRPGPQGVIIRDEETGELISASELSSGEKQIALLFSDIVALQGQTRLFLIDEPELSLNPQWQRNLMPSLLALTEGSGMQLLAATHSIEIMAKYRSRIRRLHR
jgi:energy-coupling factor transporter ATP-binding protein EcfA2